MFELHEFYGIQLFDMLLYIFSLETHHTAELSWCVAVHVEFNIALTANIQQNFKFNIIILNSSCEIISPL